ncbi:MAG: heavy metal-associated domain-containing protein, partial [Eubacteriales bacterium]|nr:heavy metal-associated domain-containing protein [Eubacteriales bacterium]
AELTAEELAQLAESEAEAKAFQESLANPELESDLEAEPVPTAPVFIEESLAEARRQEAEAETNTCSTKAESCCAKADSKLEAKSLEEAAEEVEEVQGEVQASAPEEAESASEVKAAEEAEPEKLSTAAVLAEAEIEAAEKPSSQPESKVENKPLKDLGAPKQAKAKTLWAELYAQEKTSETEAESLQYKVKIEGLKCMNCVAHAEKALQGLAGVESVEVSLERKEATVNSLEPLALEAIQKVIKDAGYKVRYIVSPKN